MPDPGVTPGSEPADAASRIAAWRLGRRPLEYGDRVQYSVFVVDARPAKLARLRTTIATIMDSGDSVLIAGLGPVGDLSAQRFLYRGRQRPITGSAQLIF